MKTESEAHRLRIFINESDRWEGRPLYEVLVREARDHGLAGATAVRGIESFGANNRVRTVKVLRLSEDLPIIVEIVDRPERIASFMSKLETLVAEGMVTLEKVRTIIYRRENGPQSSADDELQLETTDFEPPVAPAATAARAVAPSTRRAKQVIDAARKSAAESHRGVVDSVDVLLAMLCESKGIAGQALTNLGVDCETVKRSLHEQVSRDETLGNFLTALNGKSLAAARWMGDEQIGTEHLLLALCEIHPSAATDTLMRLGALPRDICREVLTIVDHENDWQRWLADHPNM
jgi:PII-like signaling protein